MAQPSDETQQIINQAIGAAYNKTKFQGVKSKVGFLGRSNVKTVAKKVVITGIGQIPIVGGLAAAGTSQALQKAENKYKSWKAAKLDSARTKSDGDIDTKLEKRYAKAALKTLVSDNILKSIDDSRKKLGMSVKEFNTLTGGDIGSCGDCGKLFYHWYRVKIRAAKYMVKIQAVQELLEQLHQQAEDSMLKQMEVYANLVDKVNEFQKDHYGNDCNTAACIYAPGAGGVDQSRQSLLAEIESDD